MFLKAEERKDQKDINLSDWLSHVIFILTCIFMVIWESLHSVLVGFKIIQIMTFAGTLNIYTKYQGRILLWSLFIVSILIIYVTGLCMQYFEYI